MSLFLGRYSIAIFIVLCYSSIIMSEQDADLQLGPSQLTEHGERTSLPPTLQELTDLLERTAESTPATADDYLHLSRTMTRARRASEGVVRTHDPNLVKSGHLRKRGDTSGREIELVTDSLGAYYGRGGEEPTPAIALGIYQGLSGKVGSWNASVGVSFNGEEVIATSYGGIQTGSRQDSVEAIPTSSRRYPASAELITWMTDQIGDPEELELAPSTLRRIASKAMRAVGIKPSQR
jgi:hypothetical protein